ncbi:ADP-ribosyltransferase [Actinocatenispora sera]|uniref:ADP-ribosyltransferase n=1 Tax=Actinocatenispora sera TaxID=390989 RepID=UPI001BB418EF|nr:ADP-ribosyltransferase [Actinocatenispora sera]
MLEDLFQAGETGAADDPHRVAEGLHEVRRWFAVRAEQLGVSDLEAVDRVRSMLEERQEQLARFCAEYDQSVAVEAERVAALWREFDASVARTAAQETADGRSAAEVTRLAADAAAEYRNFESAEDEYQHLQGGSRDATLIGWTVRRINEEMARFGIEEAPWVTELVSRLREAAGPGINGVGIADIAMERRADWEIGDKVSECLATVRDLGRQLDDFARRPDGFDTDHPFFRPGVEADASQVSDEIVRPEGTADLVTSERLGEYAADGRAHDEPLPRDEYVDAIRELRDEVETYFPDGSVWRIVKGPDGMVWVHTRDFGWQRFDVDPRPALGDHPAYTVVSRTAGEPGGRPHAVRPSELLGPGEHGGQYARSWVHEITDTLQRLAALERREDQGVLRSVWRRGTETTVDGRDDCATAQLHERAVVDDRWRRADTDEEQEHWAREIAAIDERLVEHGQQPPEHPWETDPPVPPEPPARLTRDELLDLSYRDPSLKWIREWIAPEGAPGLFGPFSRVGSEHTGVARTRDLQTGEKVAMILRSSEVWGQKFNGHDDPKPEAYRGAMRDRGEVGFEFYTDALPMRPANCIPGRVAWAHRDYMERWLPAEVVDRVEIIGLRDEGGKDTGILDIKVTRVTQHVPIPAEELQSLLWPERVAEPVAAEPEPVVAEPEPEPPADPYPDADTIAKQHRVPPVDQRRLHDVAVRLDADIEVRRVDDQLHVVDVRRHDGTEWTSRQRRALRAAFAEDAVGRPMLLERAASARLDGEPTTGPDLSPGETVLRFSAHHPPRVTDGAELDRPHPTELRPKSAIGDPAGHSGADEAAPRRRAAEPDPDRWHGDPVSEVAPAPRTVRAALHSAADEVRTLLDDGRAEPSAELDAALRRLAKYVAATGERPADLDPALLADHLDRRVLDDPDRVVDVMRQTRLGHDRYVAFMSQRDSARQELIAGEPNETQVVAHGTDDGLVALPNPAYEAHLDAGGEPSDFTDPRSFLVRPELFAHGLAVLEHEGAVRLAGQELIHGHFCLGGQRAGFEAISWRIARVLDAAVAGHTTSTADTVSGSHAIDRRSIGSSQVGDVLVHGDRDAHGLIRVFTPEDPVGRPMEWELPAGFDPELFADGVTPPAVRAIHTTVPSFLPAHLLPEMAPHEYVGVFESRPTEVGGPVETHSIHFGVDGRWRLTPGSDAPEHTLAQVLARNGELVTAVEERLPNGDARYTPVAAEEYGADWLPRDAAVHPVSDGTRWRVPDDAELPRWRSPRERHNFTFVRDHHAELETVYRRTIRHLGPSADRVHQNVEWIGSARADLRVARALGADPSVLTDYVHRRAVVTDSFRDQFRSLYSLARQGNEAVSGLAALHRQLGRTGPDAELHRQLAGAYTELGAEYKRLFGLALRHRLAVEAVSRSDAELELRRRLDQEPGRLAIEGAAGARRALAAVESRIDASLRTLGELDQRVETTAHGGGDVDGAPVGDAPAAAGRSRIEVRDELVTEFPAQATEPTGRPGGGLAVRVDNPTRQVNSASAGERLSVVARSRGAAGNSTRVVRAFEGLDAGEHADPTETLLDRLAETNSSFRPSDDGHGAEISALLVSDGRFGLIAAGGDAYLLRDGVLHQLAGAEVEPAGDRWIDGSTAAPRIAHGAVRPGDRFVLAAGLDRVAPERIEQVLTEAADPQQAARQLAELGDADDVAVTVTHVPPAGTDAGGLRDAVTVLRDQLYSRTAELPPGVEADIMPPQTVGVVRARLMSEHLEMFGDGSTTRLAQRHPVLADFAEHRADLHEALADAGAAGPHRDLSRLYRELADTATETARTEGVAGADRAGYAWEVRTTAAAGPDAVDRLHALHNRIAEAESRWDRADEPDARAGGGETAAEPRHAADPGAPDRAPTADDKRLQDPWHGDPAREVAPPPRHLSERLNDAMEEFWRRQDAMDQLGIFDVVPVPDQRAYDRALDRVVRLAEQTGARPYELPEVARRVRSQIVEEPAQAVEAMRRELTGSPHAAVFMTRDDAAYPWQLAGPEAGRLTIHLHGSRDGLVSIGRSVLLRPELFAHGLAVLAAEGRLEWSPGDTVDLTSCYGSRFGADSAASRVSRVLRTPVLGRTDLSWELDSHTVTRTALDDALVANHRPFPEVRLFTPEQPTGRTVETEVPAGLEPVRDENGELPQVLQGIRSNGPGFLPAWLVPSMAPHRFVGMFEVRHPLGGPEQRYEIGIDRYGDWRRTEVQPEGGLRQLLGLDGRPVTVQSDGDKRYMPVSSARYGLDWLPRESAVTAESAGAAWRTPPGLGEGGGRTNLQFVRDHRVEIETIWHRSLRHLDPILERVGTAVDWLGHASAEMGVAHTVPSLVGADRSDFRSPRGRDEFEQRVDASAGALSSQHEALQSLIRTGTAAVRGLRTLHQAAARVDAGNDVHGRMAAEYARATRTFERLSTAATRLEEAADLLAGARASQEYLERTGMRVEDADGAAPIPVDEARALERQRVAAAERRFAEIAWEIDTLQRDLARHEVAVDLASHATDGEQPAVPVDPVVPGRDRMLIDPRLTTEVPGDPQAAVGPLATGLHTQVGASSSMRNAAVVGERGIMVAHSVGGNRTGADLAARLFDRPAEPSGEPLTGLAERVADVNYLLGANRAGARLAALHVDGTRFAVVGSGADTYLLRDGELHRLTQTEAVLVEDPDWYLAPQIALTENDGLFGRVVRPQTAYGAVRPGDRFVVGTGLGRLDRAEITRILTETPDPQEAAARLAEVATGGDEPQWEVATVAVAGVPASGESLGGLDLPVTQLSRQVYTPAGDLPAEVTASVLGSDTARVIRSELVEQLTGTGEPLDQIEQAGRLADFAEQQADLHAELFASGAGERHDALAATYRQLATAATGAADLRLGSGLFRLATVRGLHEQLSVLERDGSADVRPPAHDGYSPDLGAERFPYGAADEASHRVADRLGDDHPRPRSVPGDDRAAPLEVAGPEMVDGVARETVEMELEYERARADEQRAFGEYLGASEASARADTMGHRSSVRFDERAERDVARARRAGDPDVEHTAERTDTARAEYEAARDRRARWAQDVADTWRASAAASADETLAARHRQIAEAWTERQELLDRWHAAQLGETTAHATVAAADRTLDRMARFERAEEIGTDMVGIRGRATGAAFDHRLRAELLAARYDRLDRWLGGDPLHTDPVGAETAERIVDTLDALVDVEQTIRSDAATAEPGEGYDEATATAAAREAYARLRERLATAAATIDGPTLLPRAFDALAAHLDDTRFGDLWQSNRPPRAWYAWGASPRHLDDIRTATGRIARSDEALLEHVRTVLTLAGLHTESVPPRAPGEVLADLVDGHEVFRHELAAVPADPGRLAGGLRGVLDRVDSPDREQPATWSERRRLGKARSVVAERYEALAERQDERAAVDRLTAVESERVAALWREFDRSVAHLAAREYWTAGRSDEAVGRLVGEIVDRYASYEAATGEHLARADRLAEQERANQTVTDIVEELHRLGTPEAETVAEWVSRLRTDADPAAVPDSGRDPQAESGRELAERALDIERVGRELDAVDLERAGREPDAVDLERAGYELDAVDAGAARPDAMAPDHEGVVTFTDIDGGHRSVASGRDAAGIWADLDVREVPGTDWEIRPQHGGGLWQPAGRDPRGVFWVHTRDHGTIGFRESTHTPLVPGRAGQTHTHRDEVLEWVDGKPVFHTRIGPRVLTTDVARVRIHEITDTVDQLTARARGEEQGTVRRFLGRLTSRVTGRGADHSDHQHGNDCVMARANERLLLLDRLRSTDPAMRGQAYRDLLDVDGYLRRHGVEPVPRTPPPPADFASPPYGRAGTNVPWGAAPPAAHGLPAEWTVGHEARDAAPDAPFAGHVLGTDPPVATDRPPAEPSQPSGPAESSGPSDFRMLTEPHPPAATVDQVVDLFDGAGTAAERPATLDDYVKVGGQGGSVSGAEYVDGEGHRRYVKAPASELHARVEWLANRLYQAAGTRVAEVDLIDLRGEFDGKQLGLSSRMLDGDTALTRWLPRREFAAALRRDFAVDAWLANWDVIGEGYNNVLITGDGVPVRLDTGGALLFRAQGTAKGAEFGTEVGELQSMLDPDRNDSAARAFRDVTAEEIRDGVARIRDITPEQIDELVDRAQLPEKEAQDLRVALRARREYLIDRYLDDAAVEQPAPAGSAEAMYESFDPAEREAFDAEVASRLSADAHIEHIHEVLRHALAAGPLAGRELTVADAAALVDVAQTRLYDFGNTHEFENRITGWLATREGQIAEVAWDGYDPRDVPAQPSPVAVRQLLDTLKGVEPYSEAIDHAAWSRRLYDQVMVAIRQRAGAAADYPVRPLDVVRMLDVARADGGVDDHHFEQQLVRFLTTPEGAAHAAGHAALDAELAQPRPLPDSSARFPDGTDATDMDRVHAAQGGDWPTEARTAYDTYLDGNYFGINGWQRQHLPQFAEYAPVCEAMDQGMRESAEDLLLRRGMSLGALGITSPAELAGLLGREIADPGFMPTSAAERAGFQAEKIQLELEVPAGTRLAWLGRISPRPEQAEVLLAPGTRIVGLRLEVRHFQGEVQYVLRARVVGQGEVGGTHSEPAPRPEPTPNEPRPVPDGGRAPAEPSAPAEPPVPAEAPARTPVEGAEPGPDRGRIASWRDEAVDQQAIAAEERSAATWHRIRLADHQRRLASVDAELARARSEQHAVSDRLAQTDRNLREWAQENSVAAEQHRRSSAAATAAAGAREEAQQRLTEHERRLAFHAEQLRRHPDQPEDDAGRYSAEYHRSQAEIERAAAQAARAEVSEFDRTLAEQQQAEQRLARSRQAVAELQRWSAADRQVLLDLDARRAAAEQAYHAAAEDAGRTEQEALSAEAAADAAERRAQELSARAQEREDQYPDRLDRHADLLRRDLSQLVGESSSVRVFTGLDAERSAEHADRHERRVELLTAAIEHYELAAALQRTVSGSDGATGTTVRRVRADLAAVRARVEELGREAGRADQEAASRIAAAQVLNRQGTAGPERVTEELNAAGQAEERAAVLRADADRLNRRADRLTALMESFADRWQHHSWARDAEFEAEQVRGWADWHDFQARRFEQLAADLAAGGDGMPARSPEVAAVAAARAELAGQPVDRLEGLAAGMKSGVNGTYRAFQHDRVVGAFKPAEAEVFVKDGQVIRAGIPQVPGQLAAREVGASDFAELLGSTLVPPTVPVEIRGMQGSLQRWVEEAQAHRPVEEYPWREQQEVAVIDYVLGNTDRNQFNFLTRDGSVVAIDHGLVLSESARDQILSPFVEAQLRTRLNADLLARVRGIDPDELRARLESRGIGTAAIDAGLARLREVQENGMIVFAERDGVEASVEIAGLVDE